MLNEIYYWKQMLYDLLDAKEDINSHIESVTEHILDELKDVPEAQPAIKQYLDEIDRVQKGLKECKWNEKYLKVVENPVQKIQNGTLEDCLIYVSPLMSSLKSIYENSNFYKEMRITSFLD